MRPEELQKLKKQHLIHLIQFFKVIGVKARTA